ncbi:MAG: hypothetical protein ACR2MG_18625 [Pyrinomonadaceae bacterium]
MIKSYQIAQILAQKLLAQAAANEPDITADLQNISSEVFAQIVGLENKFKTEESLTRKLIDLAEADSTEISRIARKINDVLRYTFVLPFETYAEGFRQAIKKLRKSGYQIPDYKIWNAWGTMERRFDKGYRGINITVISSHKQKFELQFHTEESFRLKTATHRFYEELRNRRILEKREIELIEKLRKAAENVKKPEGV